MFWFFKWIFRRIEVQFRSRTTVNGRNPAPPGTYKTLEITGYLSYQLVSRILSTNSITNLEQKPTISVSLKDRLPSSTSSPLRPLLCAALADAETSAIVKCLVLFMSVVCGSLAVFVVRSSFYVVKKREVYIEVFWMFLNTKIKLTLYDLIYVKDVIETDWHVIMSFLLVDIHGIHGVSTSQAAYLHLSANPAEVLYL